MKAYDHSEKGIGFEVKLRFRHSGDLGDLIYALAPLRARTSSELYLSCEHQAHMRALQAEGYPSRAFPISGIKEDGSAAGLTVSSIKFLLPLLELQNYLTKVDVWNRDQVVDCDIDRWRVRAKTDFLCESLAESQGRVMGVSGVEHLKNAWIFLEPGRKRATSPKIAFSRSLRYRNPKFPWRLIYGQWRKKAVFVGTKSEHEAFTQEVGPLPYLYFENAREMAECFQGLSLFVGNQSFPLSLALGLGCRTLQETSPWVPNCVLPLPRLRCFWRGAWWSGRNLHASQARRFWAHWSLRMHRWGLSP